MRNKLLILTFSLATLFSQTLIAADAQISGVVTGSGNFSTINVNTLSNLFIKSAVIDPDGRFNVSVPLKSKDCYIFTFVNSANVRRQLYMVLSPNDNISMTLTSSSSDIYIKEVSGSDEMTVIKNCIDSNNSFMKSMTSLEEEYAKAEAADRQAIQNRYYAAYQSFLKEKEQYYLKNKNMLASMLMAYMDFSREMENHTPLFKALYASLSPQYANSVLMQEVAGYVSNPIEIGNEAPDFEGTTPDGKKIKLSDFRGKYVLVDFWASWCRPCRAENPNVVEAYNRYKDKKFDILSVSLDSDANSWKSAIEADKLVWKNHLSTLRRWNCPIAKLYHVRGIPFSLLVGPDGKIVAISLRGEALQNKLSEIFN